MSQNPHYLVFQFITFESKCRPLKKISKPRGKWWTMRGKKIDITFTLPLRFSRCVSFALRMPRNPESPRNETHLLLHVQKPFDTDHFRSYKKDALVMYKRQEHIHKNLMYALVLLVLKRCYYRVLSQYRSGGYCVYLTYTQSRLITRSYSPSGTSLLKAEWNKKPDAVKNRFCCGAILPRHVRVHKYCDCY